MEYSNDPQNTFCRQSSVACARNPCRTGPRLALSCLMAFAGSLSWAKPVCNDDMEVIYVYSSTANSNNYSPTYDLNSVPESGFIDELVFTYDPGEAHQVPYNLQPDPIDAFDSPFFASTDTANSGVVVYPGTFVNQQIAQLAELVEIERCKVAGDSYKARCIHQAEIQYSIDIKDCDREFSEGLSRWTISGTIGSALGGITIGYDFSSPAQQCKVKAAQTRSEEISWCNQLADNLIQECLAT